MQIQLQQVPTMSIIGMSFSALIAIFVPIILLIVIRKKTKARISSFFIGCSAFVFFALILENLMHSFVLGNTGNILTDHIVPYALYGGIAASVFEETGRFLAMKYALKNIINRENALMYGAGHGGIEAIFLVGLTYISNLFTALLMNSGALESTLALMDKATRDLTVTQLSALWTIDSSLFFMAGIERLSAIILQIALSVFVYRTVKTGNTKYLLIAYALHFAVDAGTILVAQFVPSWVLEAIVLIAVIVIAYFAAKQYKEEAVVKEIQS